MSFSIFASTSIKLLSILFIHFNSLELSQAEYVELVGLTLGLNYFDLNNAKP